MRLGFRACLAVLAIFGLALTDTVASAGRVLSAEYTGASLLGLHVSQDESFYGLECGPNCVQFTTARSGERTMQVTVADASGTDVGWMASMNRQVRAQGCGQGQVRIRPGENWVVVTALRDACGGLPTKGRLSVRLLK